MSGGSVPRATGLFVSEGSSDSPLAEIVNNLFFRAGTEVDFSTPDYSRLDEKISKDVKSKVEAGLKLLGYVPEVVAVHRDANSVGADARRAEIYSAVEELDVDSVVLPVVPVKMTEAWLLLNEDSIRRVAGNPKGRTQLDLPKVAEVERIADPKSLLEATLLAAADVTGRRRKRLSRKFDDSRRQLIERLDLGGDHTMLDSWRCLERDVATATALL